MSDESTQFCCWSWTDNQNVDVAILLVMMDDGERAAVIPSFKPTNSNRQTILILNHHHHQLTKSTCFHCSDNDDKTSSSIPSNVIELRTTTILRSGGEKNVCVRHQQVFATSSRKRRYVMDYYTQKVVYPRRRLSLLLGLRREEREMINLKKQPHTSGKSSAHPHATAIRHRPTHIHRLGRKGFLYFLLLLFSFQVMSYTTRRVVSITWAAPKQNAAASKCHTLKAN